MKMEAEERRIMVSVIVCTYNQERWIRQTLDSILSQQTDYPYEVVIGEDMGTDGTRAICEEYVLRNDNVKLAPQDRNLGVTANLINCIKHSSGKYIMACGGDDYWHNPNKIQIQVDFMELHPECVLCHTDFNQLNIFTGVLKKNCQKRHGIHPPEGRIQMVILKGNSHIASVTTCYRRDCYEKHVPMDKFVELGFPREDWPAWLIMSAYGDICYIPESTATYRVGQESITRKSDYEGIRRQYQEEKKMAEFLYSLFPEWGECVCVDNDDDDYMWHQLLLAAYRNGDYVSACEFAKHDKSKSKARYMVRTRLTFKLYRVFLMRR